jgi:hypothetical protein
MSLLFFALIIPVSISFYRNYQVYSKGHFVVVTVKRLPVPASSKSSFMSFEMAGRIYTKKVGGSRADDLYVGEKLSLKYLEGYDYNFLFPDENPSIWGIVCIVVLFVFGIASFFTAFRRSI